MDILISSNFERLIFETGGRNDKLTKQRMEKLATEGKYTVSDVEMKEIARTFAAYSADDEITKETIADFFDESGYVLDPHSAVAFDATMRFEEETGEERIVTVCTASPYKFAASVLEAIGETVPRDDGAALTKLEEETALPLPESLSELPSLKIRFGGCVDKDGIEQAVINSVIRE